jgi:hypothetical protein
MITALEKKASLKKIFQVIHRFTWVRGLGGFFLHGPILSNMFYLGEVDPTIDFLYLKGCRGNWDHWVGSPPAELGLVSWCPIPPRLDKHLLSEVLLVWSFSSPLGKGRILIPISWTSCWKYPD